MASDAQSNTRYGHPETLVSLTGYWPDYAWESGPQRWDTREFHADEKIAPLLELCWKYGIRTSASCQGGPGGGPGSMYEETLLGFARRGDMLRFRRLTGDHPGWRWQSGFEDWAVFFPYQQLPAVIKTVRAFGPFYGEPPKPPAEPEAVEPVPLEPLPLFDGLPS